MLTILLLSIGAVLLIGLLFGVAAVHLRLKNLRKAALWERLESRWGNVLVGVLMGDHPREELLDRVHPGEHLYFVDFLWKHARRVRGREREVCADLAGPFLQPLVRRMRQGDAEQRARAVHTVGTLGIGHYADEIAAALDDPSPMVAMIAARALTHSGHPEYVEMMADRLHRFEQWSPKALASMLAGMGPPAIPALRWMLADSRRPPRQRAIAADALLELNDFAAADLAGHLLETETDEELLAAALRLLRRLGRPEHLPGIRTAAVTSASLAVRAQAVGALARLGDGGDLMMLKTAFDDPSPWVALHAARGLRAAGGGEILLSFVTTQHARAGIAQQILDE